MTFCSKLPRHPRFVFRQPVPAAADELLPATQPELLVELTVYAADALAFGRLALSGERVTDLMNHNATYEFVDTSLQSLEDGHILSVRDVVIARNEIFAVSVSGPRGDPNRRTRTRPTPVQLRLGPYDVTGNLHGLPGSDPIAGFTRRGIMVPLTEATIEYDSPNGRVSSRFETVLVNRLLADSIATPRGLDVRPPELARDGGGGRLLKDFTFDLTVR